MSDLISVEQAVGLLLKNRFPRQSERLPLTEALGRRLAEPVVAHVAKPPVAMSAMDGYAVKLSDVQRPGARLKLIGEAPAGRPFNGTVRTGTAVRIFTGAVVPEGADHIIIQENTERDGDDVICLKATEKPRHIRAAGIDFELDDPLVSTGTRLQPAHLSIAAAGNNATVHVETRLRVGLLSNGDELRRPGSDLAPGEITNSNPFGLAGHIECWGGQPVMLGTACDSIESIHAHMDAAPVDIIVPIGGASVGDHDYMHDAFSERGFEPVFQKVAVRPGKPTWFSRKQDQLALGLPGNPASALVCAHLFLAPLLGEDWRYKLVPAKLTRRIEPNGPREHFMRARLDISDDGELMVEPAPSQDSSLLSTFAQYNALLRRLPHDSAAESDARVQVLPILPIL